MVALNVWPTDAAEGSVATEAKWRKMARHWIPSGVMARIGGELFPTLGFPSLGIGNGAAWVDGHFCELEASEFLTVTTNGLAVIRFDPAANTAELVYRDGVSVPTQSPVGTWELPIAQLVGGALVDRRNMVAPGQSQLHAARYHRTANLSMPATANTPMLIKYDTKQFDINDHYNPVTGLYTAPVAGLYDVQAQLSLQMSTNVNGSIMIYRNGANAAMANAMYPAVSAVVMHAKAVLALAQGDTLGMWGQSGAASSAVRLSAFETFFSVHYLGAG